MTGNERKIKRRIQTLVVTAIVFFCTLCITVVTQLVIMGNQRSEQAALEAAHELLVKELEKVEQDMDYYLTDQFLDEYALRELGLGKEGAKIFE